MSSLLFSGNSKPRFNLLSSDRDENTNPRIDGALIRKMTTKTDSDFVFIFSFFFDLSALKNNISARVRWLLPNENETFVVKVLFYVL